MNRSIDYYMGALCIAIMLICTIACSSGEEDTIGAKAPKPTEQTGEENDPIGLSVVKNAGDTILALEAPAEVKAFFDSEFSHPGSITSPYRFFRDRPNASFCHVINSMEELQSVYFGEKELPAIDFSDKTLVIGQEYCCDIVYFPIQVLQEYEDRHVLNITVEIPDWGYDAFTLVTHWALYPKLGRKPTEVRLNPEVRCVDCEKDYSSSTLKNSGIVWYFKSEK